MSERIEDVARAMVAGGRGILAADESTGTIGKRFASIDVANEEPNRRAYREMLFRTTDAMTECISGVIMFEETLGQSAEDGTPFVELLRATDSIPGIKVDQGAKPSADLGGQTDTQGLEGLPDRLARYREQGARFAKWRAVLSIDDSLPSVDAIEANARGLAAYAKACQNAAIVPIVEPEVTMDGDPGDHTLSRCEEVTRTVLTGVFEALRDEAVVLEGMVLKPNMVIDGARRRGEAAASVDEVAEATVRVLKGCVPEGVPGVAFLSGGQSEIEATAHLNAMVAGYDTPFALTFSYGRALQAAALKAWGGRAENAEAGARAFAHRARMNHLAALGRWSEALEREAEAA